MTLTDGTNTLTFSEAGVCHSAPITPQNLSITIGGIAKRQFGPDRLEFEFTSIELTAADAVTFRTMFTNSDVTSYTLTLDAAPFGRTAVEYTVVFSSDIDIEEYCVDGSYKVKFTMQEVLS